jgi:hypothetical protein
VQATAFAHGKERNHTVYIVLEHDRHRLYSSFLNADAFWVYYNAFPGPRCFYWINRSFEVSSESSLLYLDLEWYTHGPDPEAEDKVDAISRAVTSCLPKSCEVLREGLSRTLDDGWYKNSFHLYPQVTFQHNGQSCMRDFVCTLVWGKLEGRPEMKCPKTGEPLVDLKVYTKNRVFRVPGSSKLRGYRAVPLPTREFFMASRLGDRPGPGEIREADVSRMISALDLRPAPRAAKRARVQAPERVCDRSHVRIHQNPPHGPPTGPSPVPVERPGDKTLQQFLVQHSHRNKGKGTKPTHTAISGYPFPGRFVVPAGDTGQLQTLLRHEHENPCTRGVRDEIALAARELACVYREGATTADWKARAERLEQRARHSVAAFLSENAPSGQPRALVLDVDLRLRTGFLDLLEVQHNGVSLLQCIVGAVRAGHLALGWSASAAAAASSCTVASSSGWEFPLPATIDGSQWPDDRVLLTAIPLGPWPLRGSTPNEEPWAKSSYTVCFSGCVHAPSTLEWLRGYITGALQEAFVSPLPAATSSSPLEGTSSFGVGLGTGAWDTFIDAQAVGMRVLFCDKQTKVVDTGCTSCSRQGGRCSCVFVRRGRPLLPLARWRGDRQQLHSQDLDLAAFARDSTLTRPVPVSASVPSVLPSRTPTGERLVVWWLTDNGHRGAVNVPGEAGEQQVTTPLAAVQSGRPTR